MTPLQASLGFISTIIILGMSACSTESNPGANEEPRGVVAVQPGAQLAWSNEGDQSEPILITLRSSQAQMETGDSAILKASANNRSGKALTVNMFLQLGNGLLVSSATSCTGDPCTGSFTLQDGTQALMSVQVQSSGPVAQSYPVILHYNYTDHETGDAVQGKVEGLIKSAEYVMVGTPSPTGKQESPSNITSVEQSRIIPTPVPTRSSVQKNFKPYDQVVGVIGTDPTETSLIQPMAATASSDGRIFILDHSLDDGDTSVIKMFLRDGKHLRDVKIPIRFGTWAAYPSMRVDQQDRVSLVSPKGEFVRLKPDGTIIASGVGSYEHIQSSQDVGSLEHVLDGGMMIGRDGIILNVVAGGSLQPLGAPVYGVHPYDVRLFNESTIGIAYIHNPGKDGQRLYIERHTGINGSWQKVSAFENVFPPLDSPENETLLRTHQRAKSLPGLIEDLILTENYLFVLSESRLFRTSSTANSMPWELLVELPILVNDRISLSLGNDGHIYMAATPLRKIFVVHPEEGLIEEFGTAESRLALVSPSSIAASPKDGFIWIQAAHGGIAKYNKDFQFMDRWGYAPLTLSGVTIDGNVVVMNATNCAFHMTAAEGCQYYLQIIDSAGEILQEWGGSGLVDGLDGKFSAHGGQPEVWVNATGERIYTYQWGPNQIQRFNVDGRLERSWILPERYDLCSIADDSSETVYVAVRGRDEVGVLDQMGGLVSGIAITGLDDACNLIMDQQGNLFVNKGDTVHIFDNLGGPMSQITGFGHIRAMSLDHQGHLWLAVVHDETPLAPYWKWGKVIELAQDQINP